MLVRSALTNVNKCEIQFNVFVNVEININRLIDAVTFYFKVSCNSVIIYLGTE